MLLKLEDIAYKYGVLEAINEWYYFDVKSAWAV